MSWHAGGRARSPLRASPANPRAIIHRHRSSANHRLGYPQGDDQLPVGRYGPLARCSACSVQPVTKYPRITYTDFAHSHQIPRHFSSTLQISWHLRVFPQRQVPWYNPPNMEPTPSLFWHAGGRARSPLRASPANPRTLIHRHRPSANYHPLLGYLQSGSRPSVGCCGPHPVDSRSEADSPAAPGKPLGAQNLGGLRKQVNLEKRTQFKMDVITYSYGGYAQFGVFENFKTNPISPVLYPADPARRRCPAPRRLSFGPRSARRQGNIAQSTELRRKPSKH